ncbi:MAG TPA: FAD-dependent oxidoreductase, partial [Clostridiales bacterium]|nr:FAD-dependent oxidoreductase [Clostridiales bacterium]
MAGYCQAGRIAVGSGFKGVINDIELEGFTPPPIRRSKIEDGTLDNARPDVLIIGGGVIGCAIARELSKHKLDIILVEKESDVAMHASSRNDGMIHPGIASHPGTLRGDLNVQGNFLYTRLCDDLGVPFERYGNLILFSSHLFGSIVKPVLASRQKKFGIEGGKISLKRLKEIEPNITDEAVGAFEYPSSGVLSPYKLTVALADNAIENGARFSLNTIVESMELENGAIVGVKTNRGTIRPRMVINAAGVFSDIVAQMANDRFFTIHPRKGECAILDKKKGPLVTRSMGLIGFSMLTSDTKGGGVMRTIDQNVLVGPDAYEQPLREDFSTNAENMNIILEKHLPLIKGFQKSDVIAYFSGIRAATYEEEFIVEKSDYVKNLIHAAGIQSPGLAAAPAIAEKIAEITKNNNLALVEDA